MNPTDQSRMKQNCDNQKECFEMLQSILDGEATPQEKEHFLKEHLEQCMPCYKNYHLEVAIRDLLKAKCTQHAPPDLVENIKRTISQKMAQ
jgi:anti-sigma factor (TIGR02949 family)